MSFQLITIINACKECPYVGYDHIEFEYYCKVELEENGLCKMIPNEQTIPEWCRRNNK